MDDGSVRSSPTAFNLPLPYYDRVAVYSPTVGTGTLSLGGALVTYQSFQAAGVPNGQGVRYVIVDGPQWEIGWGVYSSASTLTRGDPMESSNGGAPINCDGNQAVFLAPTSVDWAQLQTGWLLDVIDGAATNELGYLTRTGNEVYGITAIPTYTAGIFSTANVVQMVPLMGDVIGGAGQATSIYWVGMLNASTPLAGNELMLVYQGGSSRTVSAANVMMNIPGYPSGTVPVAGTELMPVWQGGQNRSIAVSALMLNIPGYVQATVPLTGPEQFLIYQGTNNATITYNQLADQLLALLGQVGIPAQMVVNSSQINNGTDGEILFDNEGILGEVPNLITLGTTALTLGGTFPNLNGAILVGCTAQVPSTTDNSGAVATTAFAVPRAGGTMTGSLTIGGTNVNIIITAGGNQYMAIGTTFLWNVTPVSGGNNYWANGAAGAIAVGSAGMVFYIAASGTAGGPISFIQAMVVNTAGNVAITNALSVSGTLGVNGSITSNSGCSMPSISYPGTEGHAIAFGWDGTWLRLHVDGTYIDAIATYSWCNSTFATSSWVSGSFLALSGGQITGQFVVSGGVIINSSGGSMYGNWATVNGQVGVNMGGGVAFYGQTPVNTDCKIQLTQGVPNGGGWGWQVSCQGYSSPGQFWVFNDNYSWSGFVIDTGANCWNQHGTWNALSDQRVKTVVGDYMSGLEQILALNPIRFRYNGKARTEHSGEERIGLAAEAVREVMPEATRTLTIKLNEDDEVDSELLGVDSGPLLYALINAVKELAAKVATLEARG